MMTHEQKVDVVQEAAKSAPPVAVTAASTLMGFSLHEWMLIATIIYIVIQTCWLFYKWHRASKNKDWHPH